MSKAMKEKTQYNHIFITDGAITIGRSADCTVSINSMSVAFMQCRIERRAGRTYLHTIKNSATTRLNGSIVMGRDILLSAGDSIEFGNVKVYVSEDGVSVDLPVLGDYLSVKGLTCTRRNSLFGKRVTILDDIYVDVPERSLVAVLGETGAGKTSFVNAIIGYERVDKGEIQINGRDIANDWDTIKQKIGYVPQIDLLRDSLTVRETLFFASRLRLSSDVSNREIMSKIEGTLAMLNLDGDTINKRVRTLSGGERKRVSIAQELIADPQIIFLDEPTSGLDPKTEAELVHSLQHLAHNRGKTLMVVTHTISNIDCFDKMLFFGKGGRLCYSGDVKAAPRFFGVDSVEDIYYTVEAGEELYGDKCRRLNGGV